MRNWNAFTAVRSLGSDLDFYSTYEELKLSYKNFYRVISKEIFTLPMRNWNLDNEIIDAYRDFDFYSTYEELKLAIHRSASFHFFYFYSTYEELKPVVACLPACASILFLLYLWGIETAFCYGKWRLSRCNFYSTYEELKL